MALTGGSGSDQQFTEINITPLTDIFLVLLIIMMVIAPMFQNVDQNIEIPEINSGLNVEEKEIIVSITKEGQFFINKTPAPIETLTQDLAQAKEKSQEKSIVLRADKFAKNKDVITVIKAAQAAGLEKLTIAGEPLSKKQQKDLTEGLDKPENQ
ncbi:MAG: biopolymer transporter ExbD [Cyanobacteriota bacterium]